MSVPSRTMHWWRKGEKLPGSSARSSSRGKKTRPTGRADGVWSLEMDGFIPRHGQLAHALAPRHHRRSARPADRVIVARTIRHDLLEHARPDAHDLFLDGLLDLGKGRMRVRRPPVRQCAPHSGHHVFVHRPPSLLRWSPEGPLYVSIARPVQPAAKS